MDDQNIRRDPRNSELIDINSQIHGHNERIKNITKVAEQTNDTTNKIATQLGGQREVINRNIEMNQEIKANAKLADKKTTQMLRRNFCIKFTLCLVIIVLFAANMGLLIWKINKHKNDNSSSN